MSLAVLASDSCVEDFRDIRILEYNVYEWFWLGLLFESCQTEISRGVKC